MRSTVKADLHLHTVYSDGASRPEDYVKEAILKGFNVISITDHNTFKGCKVALEYQKDKNIENIVIIPGAEIRTDIGDILVYCMEPQDDDFPRGIYELAEWASERNCILVPAHPLDIFRHGIGLSNLFKYPWKVVETHNGGVIIPFLNSITYAIARRLSVSCIGNSDAHHVSCMGSCYTLIRIESLDIENILKSIILGLTVPVEEGYPTRLRRRLRSIIVRRILRTS